MSSYSNVQDLGVPSNGTPCGALLNKLLNQGQRSLYLPDGEYLIEETLRLPSGTQLKLDSQAVLKLADGAATENHHYLLTNADHQNGNQEISIEGGKFHGNQVGNPRPEGLLDDGYTGAMVHFENCTQLSLKNIICTNSEAYYIRFTHVYDFQVEGISFDSDQIRPNNDGIHLGGNCARGVIRNIRALSPEVTGDDLVALNADDALQRTEVRGMTNGPIEDITIENLSAESCHSFVRMLSVGSPIRNVTVRNITGGCVVCLINADGARHCRVKVFDDTDPAYANGVGHLENIHVSNVKVWKAKATPLALIDIQERLTNFTVENCERVLANDQAPDTPTIRFANIEMPQSQLNGETIPAQNTLAPNSAFESQVTKIDHLKID